MYFDPTDWLLVIVVIVGLATVYCMPWFIASAREHPQKVPIIIINLLLGGTAIGWVIALAWACSRIKDEDRPPQFSKFVRRTPMDFDDDPVLKELQRRNKSEMRM